MLRCLRSCVHFVFIRLILAFLFVCFRVMACDADLRADLLANVVLAGATTMLHGFTERVHKELVALHSAAVNVTAPCDRHVLAWRGGAMLARQPTFQQMWITSEEYDEMGPSIVHRKCFC